MKFIKQTPPKEVKERYEPPESVLFLPLLFFIAGIRVSKFAFVISILIASVVFSILLRLYFLHFRSNIGRYFNPLRNIIVLLALSMLCGVMYFKFRCESKIFPSRHWQRNVTLTLKADTIVIKNKGHGIFYGYGVIDNVSKSYELKGGRIFFAVECTNGTPIPFRGQKFKIQGNLKYVKENSNWWFFKHLKRMHVDWMLSDGCLLSWESKASPWQVFFRKIFDRFLHTISIGVENKEIEHGIMSGMLTGYKQGIDKPSRVLFNDLGISHLFAVSGIHIGILAVTIDFFLKIICIPKKFRVLPILILLVSYVSAIGCSPSSVRALTMVAFYFMSSLLGRKPTVLSALTNSALLHVLCDPFVVFNISFLLSYAVVAGIILIGIPLKNFLSHIFLNLHGLKFESYPLIDRVSFRLKKSLIASFSISFAAYFVSLPISLDHFGVLSLLTIPANMFIVPLATLAIIIGAITLFFGLWKIWPLCAILNNISCGLIYIFRLLAHAVHCDACCYRNITIQFIGGASLTMLILVGAYTGRATRMQEFNG
ncbi:MAG: ComEC/Rec2 family competence protein [Puniceicoccales bacterium]|nr:ComEC/Rec2 family competence protein [Puniceicoccales bacterium]